MYSNRVILNSVFFALMLMCSPLTGALKYQQEVTISTFTSEEDSRDMANQFVRAADGDPNIKVVDIRYEQEKLGKDCTSYNAVITCHVSKSDVDVARVQEKMVQNNENLIRGNF